MRDDPHALDILAKLFIGLMLFVILLTASDIRKSLASIDRELRTLAKAPR